MKLYDKVIFYSLYLILMWLFFDRQSATLKAETSAHLSAMGQEITLWEDKRFKGS